MVDAALIASGIAALLIVLVLFGRTTEER